LHFPLRFIASSIFHFRLSILMIYRMMPSASENIPLLNYLFVFILL